MQVKYYIPVLVVAALMAGCGGKPGLRGKVVFSDDQSPVTKGIVVFENESDKSVARGELDQNGNYAVSSLKANDGIAPGKYRVYLTNTENYKPNPGGGLEILENTVDFKYHKPDSSGLTVDVKKSTTFDFEVDRFDPSKR
ncbi:MAG: hypothetical protein FWH27_17095 [Planctomycetaceae bacterium]|nr:hypothetical protein [Planctomycetaceae bacterium]